MGKHFPIFATSKTAAALFEMTESAFLNFVSEGTLPKAKKIGNAERWDTEELISVVRGEALDGYEDVEW